MKRCRICLVLWLALALCCAVPSYAGDGNKETPSPQGMEGPVPPFTKHRLTEQRDAVEYPQFGKKGIDALLEQTVRQMLSEPGCDEPGKKDEQSVSYALYASTERYVSVVYSLWQYFCGAAHGNYVLTPLSLDMEADKSLSLGDIFPKWRRSGPQVNRAIEQKILEEQWDYADMLNLCAGVQVEAKDTSFVFMPETLEIIFQCGPPPLWEHSSVSFDLQELEALGARMHFWER